MARTSRGPKPSADILKFYEPGSDYTIRCGRKDVTLRQILHDWTNENLEGVHTYIQWLFPLPWPAGNNPTAAVMDENVFYAFRSDIRYRNQMRIALTRMMDFYGYSTSSMLPNCFTRIDVPHFYPQNPQDRPYWGKKENYNHLRISRILRCLSLLGLEREAIQFYICLCWDVRRGRIGPEKRSLDFWKRACLASMGSYTDPDEAATSVLPWVDDFERTERTRTGKRGSEKSVHDRLQEGAFDTIDDDIRDYILEER